MSIECYKNTIETYMTWDEANKYCLMLGDGWRLPNKDELIYLFNNHIDKFGNYGCWGDKFSTEFSWSVGFKTGNIYLNPIDNKNYLIPVRNVTVDKTYWGSDLPRPLSPSDEDVEIYKKFIQQGTTLLLGCTRKLIPLSDRQLDLDPWYNGDTVIKGDWVENKHYYTNIILDGGLCFTKELCDKIINMTSKNCKRFIVRSFTQKLDSMKIAAYFPTFSDFKIKPTLEIKNDNYNFYIWEF